jgi:hypothetical protein
MVSSDTQEYLANWNKKVDLIAGNELRDVFEKFSSLYKIYGRLYNDASTELVNRGILNKNGGDQNGATENVIQYLTADVIIDAFRSSNESDIAALIGAIPHFNIKFTPNGQHEPNVDTQLLQDLQSKNSNLKALSILQIIYFVRCNYEHSRKDFQEHQRLLVEPLINLLKTLNSLLTTELSK